MAENNAPKSKGLAVASLVCGIISIVGAFFGTYAWIGMILGILAIVFAIVAKKQKQEGPATAGLVTGIIGLVLSLIMFIACIACVACASGVANNITEDDINNIISEIENAS